MMETSASWDQSSLKGSGRPSTNSARAAWHRSLKSSQLPSTLLQIDTLGLQLAEGKELLRQVQEVVIEEQVRSCLAQQVPCPHCGRPRRHKDVDSIVAHAVRDAACGQPTQSVLADLDRMISALFKENRELH